MLHCHGAWSWGVYWLGCWTHQVAWSAVVWFFGQITIDCVSRCDHSFRVAGDRLHWWFPGGCHSVWRILQYSRGSRHGSEWTYSVALWVALFERKPALARIEASDVSSQQVHLMCCLFCTLWEGGVWVLLKRQCSWSSITPFSDPNSHALWNRFRVTCLADIVESIG